MENHEDKPAKAGVTAANVNELRLEKHRSVARALRGGAAAGADEVLALAREQVALWERGHLCSQDYIDAWKALLQDPQRAAQILEERSSRAAALRQNSPFVASIRKFDASTRRK